MTIDFTPNTYTLLHAEQLLGFKSCKKMEYSYPTNVVKIVVKRHRSVKVQRFILRDMPSTTFKKLEDEYFRIK